MLALPRSSANYGALGIRACSRLPLVAPARNMYVCGTPAEGVPATAADALPAVDETADAPAALEDIVEAVADELSVAGEPAADGTQASTRSHAKFELLCSGNSHEMWTSSQNSHSEVRCIIRSHRRTV